MQGEGAAPPPAMCTKKEAHRHKSRWISIKMKCAQGTDDAYEKGSRVGSKGGRFKNKSGWGGAGGRARRLPRNAYLERST